LEDLRGRGKHSTVNALALLRDVAREYDAEIIVSLSDKVGLESAEDMWGVLGYDISLSDLPHSLYFRDLRSIIAPFHPVGWPSEYSVRKAFGEYLAPAEKFTTVVPGTETSGKQRQSQLDLGQMGFLPSMIIAWTPEVLSESDYARLVANLGDIARNFGAAGVERVLTESVGTPESTGVLK